MQPDPSKIRALLKKTQHHDKDERYMATSDLASELECVGVLDSSLQTPIREAILKQLDDPSNDVQSVACRCLCSIVQKFVCEQVEEIIDTLGLLLVNGKLELRDIYSIALKNIISAVPEYFGQQICKKLVRRLLQGLKKEKNISKCNDEEMKEEERNYFNRLIYCLDIMKDLTARFGFMMSDDHTSIMQTIQPMLCDNKIEVRKKVAISLGAIVGTVNDNLFNNLMNYMCDVIKKLDSHNDKLFTFIQAIGIFARNAGSNRVSVYLNDITSLLIGIINKVISDHSQSAIDLRENCLQTFVILMQCPNQMLLHTESLMNICLQLMKYDPNYDYELEFKQQQQQHDQEEEDDDDEEEEEWDHWDANDNDMDDWSDNDDQFTIDNNDNDTTSTWKVRRAAIKMLTSFIEIHRRRQITTYHVRICESLLDRFKEHDTSVVLDIFLCFQQLLLDISSCQLMSQKLPLIMRQICQQFKSSTANTKVKNGLLGILHDLLHDNDISKYFNDLIPQMNNCILQNNDVQLKSRSLYVLYLIFDRHSSDCLPIISLVKASIIESINSSYPSHKTRAMLILPLISEIIRFNYDNKYNEEFNSIIYDLFIISYKQLHIKDIGSEVTEVSKAALQAITSMISRFGDTLLYRMINDTLIVLNDRLYNELECETSLECITILCESPLNINISSIINKVFKQACIFLNTDTDKSQTISLRICSANTVKSLIRAQHNCNILSEHIYTLIKQCSEYINDSDLHLCALILELIQEIININGSDPVVCSFVCDDIFPQCFKLLQSSLLQGHALNALKALFKSFYLQTNGKILSFMQIKNKLLNNTTVTSDKLSRQSYSSIAQCLSVLLLLECTNNCDNEVCINEIIKLIDSHNESYSQVALLTIGELGRQGKDLSSNNLRLQEVIFNAFNCQSESVKWAASFALGNIAIGNIKLYVPSLIVMINKYTDRQYLLLNSLKEIITYYSANNTLSQLLLPFSCNITPLLLNNACSIDEGVRAMIAECIGKFAVIDNKIFTKIEKNMNIHTASKYACATMCTAIKYVVQYTHCHGHEIPQGLIDEFLINIGSISLLVRRQTFLSINTILRVNYSLILPSYSLILPIIYESTITDISLMREVDLGPFKHRVDDGLSLRKAAFTCLDSLLDSTPHKIDLFEFIKYLRNGLTDESPDIQMLTYQIFYKIATFHGSLVVSILDTLPSDLMKGMKQKMNQAKGNKDCQRAKDILRAACKALYTLRNVPNVNKARKFVTFYCRVEKTKILIPMLTELKNQAPKLYH